MRQLSKPKTFLYHLYPGLFITAGFIILAPVAIRFGYPPQFGMLIAVITIALPLLITHLYRVKKLEHAKSIFSLNEFKTKLPQRKLVLYVSGLIVYAFLVWGLAAPLDQLITRKYLYWLPDWFTVQQLAGYDSEKIKITLILNLLINGVLAPYIEELYFRGYLLARMGAWGKSAFLLNALLFSLYHFWQPYVFVTLVISMLPMVFLVQKTKDFRLSVLTHSLLNIIGAALSFALFL